MKEGHQHFEKEVYPARPETAVSGDITEWVDQIKQNNR